MNDKCYATFAWAYSNGVSRCRRTGPHGYHSVTVDPTDHSAHVWQNWNADGAPTPAPDDDGPAPKMATIPTGTDSHGRPDADDYCPAWSRPAPGRDLGAACALRLGHAGDHAAILGDTWADADNGPRHPYDVGR